MARHARQVEDTGVFTKSLVGTKTRQTKKLKEWGLSKLTLTVSDAHKDLEVAIGECYLRAYWQRCKVHFIHNILVHVPFGDKERLTSLLKGIWLTDKLETAKH